MHLEQKCERLMKWTVCANEIVFEEEHQATLHKEFLGGSKISYSTPHSREAHTHTNLDQITHTVVGHNTKPSTHTRLISLTPSYPHTHTQRNIVQTKEENNLLSSSMNNPGGLLDWAKDGKMLKYHLRYFCWAFFLQTRRKKHKWTQH